MRLNSTTSEAEILADLTQAALQSWGPERLESLRPTLATFARAIWAVLQVPLEPLSEEPDLPEALRRGAPWNSMS
jgi:hypothetical protein